MNLNDMLQSNEYMAWHSDRMNNLTHTSPDRSGRCMDFSEQGADGSFHAEIMNDWQNYLEVNANISERDYHEISIEIQDCWDWHDKEGSLYDEVGS